MNDLSTDNPAAMVADNPATEPAAALNGTGGTGGQAQGGAPTEDLFKGVDPNRLPPEVKAHYDSMLRDYREKTGKLSETIKSEVAKSTESLRAKAELYDQIATQEEFVRQWNEYVQKSQQPQTQQGDPELAQMKQKLQEINQKLQMSELSQITEAFAEAVNEKGEKLHPEFDQFNQIMIGQVKDGDKAEDFSLLRACVELASGNTPQEKLANGYKQMKQVYDQIFEAGKKAGMGRLQAKALNGSLPPSNSGADVLSVTEKRPKTAREALELARKNVMVSRD